MSFIDTALRRKALMATLGTGGLLAGQMAMPEESEGISLSGIMDVIRNAGRVPPRDVAESMVESSKTYLSGAEKAGILGANTSRNSLISNAMDLLTEANEAQGLRDEMAQGIGNIRSRLPLKVVEDLNLNVLNPPNSSVYSGLRGQYYPDIKTADVYSPFLEKNTNIPTKVVPSPMDVASTVVHESAHHHAVNTGLADLLHGFKLGDASEIVQNVTRSLPSAIRGTPISVDQQKNMILSLKGIFKSPQDTVLMIKEMENLSDTSVHNLNEMVAVATDIYVNDLAKSSRFKDTIYNFGKAFLGTSPVVVGAIGLGLGLGSSNDAEAAIRIHMSPTAIEKLLPMAKAPTKQGTGGMREGAGLYTTEVQNTEVQNFYKNIFKEKTYKSPEAELSNYDNIEEAVRKTNRSYDPLSVIPDTNYRYKKIMTGLEQTQGKIANIKQWTDDPSALDDARRSLVQGKTFEDMIQANLREDILDLRFYLKDLKKEFGEDFSKYADAAKKLPGQHTTTGDFGDKTSQSFADYYGLSMELVGSIIAYKSALKNGIKYTPGSPGVAFKHTLETFRDDADFMYRRSKLSEQPAILKKVQDLFRTDPEIKKKLLPELTRHPESFIDDLGRKYGKDIQVLLDGMYKERSSIKTSEKLHKAGIAGVRYLVNGGEGPGFNEVLFAPEKDAMIKDIVKLGIPLAVATTAVMTAYEGMENNAEASPLKLLEAGSKTAQKVTARTYPKDAVNSNALKEAWRYTFPAGPYEGKTIDNIVRSPSKDRKLWYLMFTDGSVGRVDKEEVELLAKNLGIHRYMNKFEDAGLRDKKIQAVGSLVNRKDFAESNPELTMATPIERLEKVHKLGLPIQPYTQVKYKGFTIELPTPYAQFLIDNNIVERI